MQACRNKLSPTNTSSESDDDAINAKGKRRARAYYGDRNEKSIMQFIFRRSRLNSIVLFIYVESQVGE